MRRNDRPHLREPERQRSVRRKKEHFLFSIQLGISSSQQTFIFFRGVGQPPTSNNQYMYTYSPHPIAPALSPMNSSLWSQGKERLSEMEKTLMEEVKTCEAGNDRTTVDGRNPAPVDRWFVPLFIGF